jgi:SAM-dependent MidA family methyltransferase
MCAKSPSLNDLIAAEIAATGPLTFARFMERALYHPEHGYYASGRARIGRDGDFFTNVSVGPIFGRVLADQFAEMWHKLGAPASFVIVEQGANDGTLAADILGNLSPEIPTAYHIVEPLPALRSAQQHTLAAHHEKVRWFENLDALPEFTGLHFSNELVDALPFHLVRSHGSGWEELSVTVENGAFVFLPLPPSPETAPHLSALPTRPAGYTTELRPAADAWLNAVSSKLRTGYILLADYGFPRGQLLAPHRTDGTFSCYRNHRRDADPLADPGQKDITAHVDFTALAETALQAGLRFEGFTDQHHFLVGASQSLLHSLAGPPDTAKQKSLRALQTLLHPQTMGTQFHYIAFSQGLEHPAPLSGFQFAATSLSTLLAE